MEAMAVGMRSRIHRRLSIEELEQRIAPAWVELGAGSATGGGISDNASGSVTPSIAVGLDGNPVVVWEDSDGDAEIYLRR